MNGTILMPMMANINVEGITLLSAEEARALPEEIRNIDCNYWLRSNGAGPHYAAYAHHGGTIVGYGDISNYIDYNVRPALIIANMEELRKEYDLGLHSKMVLFGRYWTVINNSMILADQHIGNYYFDLVSNDYKTSKIKKYLEEWLDNQLTVYN